MLKYDIVVVGGGFAGSAAAIAAGRNGAPFFGGERQTFGRSCFKRPG